MQKVKRLSENSVKNVNFCGLFRLEILRSGIAAKAAEQLSARKGIGFPVKPCRTYKQASSACLYLENRAEAVESAGCLLSTRRPSVPTGTALFIDSEIERNIG